MADDPPLLSRDELIALVARAHHDAAYGESTLAGKTLAAQSKLPRLIAENLGAGFGQWNFFPEAADIVDFACSYAPPSTEDEMWALARTWATDDATARHTPLALIGSELLLHELKRVEVPKLRELFEERRATRALAMRAALGLAVPEKAEKAEAAAKPERPARSGAGARAAAPKREIPTKMPKPEFVRPVKAAPPPPPKRFVHPKFGEGVLESQDGAGEDAKLTIKFAVGSKTLLARYVTECPGESDAP